MHSCHNVSELRLSPRDRYSDDRWNTKPPYSLIHPKGKMLVPACAIAYSRLALETIEEKKKILRR